MSGNLVSVIIPVYNAKRTLQGCLDSILMQSHRNLEVILVDNASDDGSAQICARMAELDARVRHLSQPAPGVSGARNMGLDNARGSWIAFVDSDDAWASEDVLERLLAVASNSGSEIVGMRDYVVKPPQRRGVRFEVMTSEEAVVGVLQLSLPTAVWAYLYAAEAVREIRFSESIHIFEDALFNIFVLSSSESVAFLPGQYYNYVPVDDSASRQKFNDRWMTILDAARMIDTSLADGSAQIRASSAVFWRHCVASLVYVMSSAGSTVSPKEYARVRAAARRALPATVKDWEASRLDGVIVASAAVSPRIAIFWLGAIRRVSSWRSPRRVRA